MKIYLNDTFIYIYTFMYTGSQAGITCGLADFIAQEEMDRYEGIYVY
jgi:hypothetical protein